MTNDPAAAIAFYTSVIGWKTQPWDAHYTMITTAQGPIGGVMKLPEEASKMGAPPSWSGYVQVDDASATVAAVKELGGRVHVEPQEIPKVGRFAVIADPQGAAISVIQPNEDMTPRDREKHGEICWHELLSSDAPAGLAFYEKLFGWKKHSEFDMGPMGKYLLFGKEEGKDLGGMFTKSKDMPMPPAWIYYVRVDDLDASVERAKSKGGKLMNGPMEVPGGMRIAQLTDPQGAFFALHGK
jgi:predicted enzyme related to lactoylglutathione lyase